MYKQDIFVITAGANVFSYTPCRPQIYAWKRLKSQLPNLTEISIRCFSKIAQSLYLPPQICSPKHNTWGFSITIYPSWPAAIRASSTSEDGSGLPSLCLCLGNHCHLIQASPRGMLLLQIYNRQGGCQTGFWHGRVRLGHGQAELGRGQTVAHTGGLLNDRG